MDTEKWVYDLEKYFEILSFGLPEDGQYNRSLKPESTQTLSGLVVWSTRFSLPNDVKTLLASRFARETQRLATNGKSPVVDGLNVVTTAIDQYFTWGTVELYILQSTVLGSVLGVWTFFETVG